MTQRYELKAVRNYTTKNGEEKSEWQNLGMLWPKREGDGFDVSLKSVPVGEGWRIMALPPRPKDGQSMQQNTGGEPSDEIPF